MQLFEQAKLVSFAFLAEIKQLSRKSQLLCDFFLHFFLKKMKRDLVKLRAKVPYLVIWN